MWNGSCSGRMTPGAFGRRQDRGMIPWRYWPTILNIRRAVPTSTPCRKNIQISHGRVKLRPVKHLKTVDPRSRHRPLPMILQRRCRRQQRSRWRTKRLPSNPHGCPPCSWSCWAWRWYSRRPCSGVRHGSRKRRPVARWRRRRFQRLGSYLLYRIWSRGKMPSGQTTRPWAVRRVPFWCLLGWLKNLESPGHRDPSRLR